MSSLGGFIGFIILCLAGLFGGAYLLDSASCHSKYASWQPTYGFLQGCQVVVKGQRIPADSLRGGEL